MVPRPVLHELDARFEAGFDASLSISADAHALRLRRVRCSSPAMHARPVGCGAIKFHPGAPAELKRMWVAPGARGIGLGRQILGELERLARDGGAQIVRLETNRALSEAIALYRGSGFREVAAFNDEPYAHHWFEKRLSQPGRGAKTRAPPLSRHPDYTSFARPSTLVPLRSRAQDFPSRMSRVRVPSPAPSPRTTCSFRPRDPLPTTRQPVEADHRRWRGTVPGARPARRRRRRRR